MKFLVTTHLEVLWWWRKKGLSIISPLLYILYKHFLTGTILRLRDSNARRAPALMGQWVSAKPGSHLPHESWGSSGHSHLCFPHPWSAKEENTDSRQ